MTEINFFTLLSEIRFEEINAMKTLLKIFLASAVFMSCSKEDNSNGLVSFKVVSSTSKKPVYNSVLEIRETMSAGSRLLTQLNANSMGEMEVPKQYASNYGFIKAPGYKDYNGILLNAAPSSRAYAIEPVFWMKLHLQVQSDSIANLEFSPWGNWTNLKTTIDTVYPVFEQMVRYPQVVPYRYSSKRDPNYYYVKILSYPIIEHDTISVSVKL